MANNKNSMAVQVNGARTAIHNALDDAEIMAALGAFNVGPAEMAEGQAKLATVERLIAAQDHAQGQQTTLTTRVQASETAARNACTGIGDLCRSVLTPAQRRAIQLKAMPSGSAQFVQAGYALFDNITGNAEVTAALARYNHDAAKLATERAKVAAFDALNRQQEAAKADAQQATKDQKTALQELATWLKWFLGIARLALKPKPLLLKKLVPTTPDTNSATPPAAPGTPPTTP